MRWTKRDWMRAVVYDCDRLAWWAEVFYGYGGFLSDP